MATTPTGVMIRASIRGSLVRTYKTIGHKLPRQQCHSRPPSWLPSLMVSFRRVLSSSTTAFAADCVLDFISSAIVLWRYYGDLNSVYMHAREQIACFYLGVLFEVSAVAIIIKAFNDIMSDTDILIETESERSFVLVYLAVVATIALSVLTVFKCDLYKTLRDNSILLDMINTLISTLFAISIIMSQVLINVYPSVWYVDPILSIVLALFMMGFGIKVIHQNFNILKPMYYI